MTVNREPDAGKNDDHYGWDGEQTIAADDAIECVRQQSRIT